MPMKCNLKLFLFFLVMFIDNQMNADGIITTIPKAGTHFFISLIQALNIPLSCAHYAIDSEESREWHARWAPWHLPLLKTPESFTMPTVIVIRDLRDLMASACYWIEQIAQREIYCPATDRLDLQEFYRTRAEEFQHCSPEEQLLHTINMSSLAIGHMMFTKHSIELVTKLMFKNEKVFIIHFEDIIGEESGGNLTNQERNILISNMCHFLGYERSPEQIETAIKNIFGNSYSFNPVKVKVGRWKNQFSKEHIALFESMWNDFNVALGYPSI
jgi:hypothetical protein